MKAWIDPAASRSIPPFAIPADRLPVLNVRFAESLQAELSGAGFTLAGKPEARALVVGPGIFVNGPAARALVDRAGPGGGRLRLRAPGWARMAGGSEARDLDVAIIPGPDWAPGHRRKTLPAVEIDADEQAFSVARGPEALDVPAPRRVAVEVRTWADLLWLNLFCMTARVRNLSAAKGLGLVALAALRARSVNPWRIAGKLVERGRGCDVHPSATVEASILGPGVRIGPGAVVRGSILGPGVEVEELALVAATAVGEESRIQRQAMVKFSVLGSRVSVGGVVQLSVLADGASTRSGSWIMDRRLDGGPVRVRTAAGAMEEAGHALGAALGYGASLGSGVWVAAGRAIPGGVILTRSPQEVLAKIPAELPSGVYAVEGGTAVAVASRAAPA